MKQVEFERKEELKHLKKKEMNEKLRKIRETAGIARCLLDEHDLDQEFDPEEHDRKMSEAFDNKFYEAEDVDPEFGSDEEDGELKNPNFDDFGDEEKVINKELEEYYKLDYEDTIGDLKTRFKYRPVNKNNYGLKPVEIWAADEKQLNQLIPLKKLATYREEEFVVPRNKIKEEKQRIKSLIRGESSRKKMKVVVDAETEKPKCEENEKELSRKQRRKKRLNELKLPARNIIKFSLNPIRKGNTKLDQHPQIKQYMKCGGLIT